MHCCNLDSELAETLNFLRPPVLRGFGRTCRGSHSRSSTGINYRESSNLLRDFRTKGSKRIQIPVAAVSSSTSKEVSPSVIYRKTSEEKIPEKYSVLRFTNFQHSNKTVQYQDSVKDKPVIQVTVIPKLTDLQLRKRVDSEPPHVTVSNQENSTKSSNVYLVVSSRKKERVYEVKSTGSAEIASRSYVKHERGPVDEVNDFKQVIDSLNMDKKKKKERKPKDDGKSKKGSGKNTDDERSRQGSFAERNIMVGGDACSPYCSYPCTSKKSNQDDKDLKSRKSRVRITGRIGLTEDDQYVLKCAATVDNKPIIANVAQIPLPPEMSNKDLNKTDFRSYEQDYYTNNSRDRNMKDSNIQADFQIETSYDTAHASLSPRKEVQYDSSENYNTVTLSNIETLKIVSNKNANIQFNGPSDIAYKGNHNVEFHKYDRSQYPNCCTNPLVIISVYPKEEPSEVTKVGKPTVRDSVSKSPPKMNAFGALQRNHVSLGVKPKSQKETRSPSPRSTRSLSPSHSPPTSLIPSPTQKQVKVKYSIVQTDSKTEKHEKKESAAQTPKNHITPQRTEAFKHSKKKSPRNIGTQSKTVGKKPVNTNSASEEKKNSADVQMTKKALVDTYTKRITEQLKNNSDRKYPTKSNVSNVTINIDGEHEFYNLMFHQGNQTTDLRVRRSVKEQASQMQEFHSPSMANFVLSEHDHDPATRKRSFSQTFYEPSNPDLGLQLPILPRFTVRDSIEISHRRDRNCSSKNEEESKAAVHSSQHHGVEYSNVPAPSESSGKHFQGDDCLILDPIQRDKEIRQLLGVKRSRSKLTEAEVKSGIYNSELSSFWCGNNCLLREIEGSIDSYYNLSTSSTFEEQMNTILNTSPYYADVQCQTESINYNPPKSRGRPSDPCYSVFFKNSKVTKSDVKKARPKKVGSRSLINELCHLKLPKQQTPDGGPKCSKITNVSPEYSEKSDVCPEYIKKSNRCPEYSNKPNECPDSNGRDAQCPTIQQIVLNRSINVYLEVKKFSKRKPIVLSRKQYEKVKKAIGNSNLNKNRMPNTRKSDKSEGSRRKVIPASDDEPACYSEPACDEKDVCDDESACCGEPAYYDEPCCYDEPACFAEPTCDEEPACCAEPTCDEEPAYHIEPTCDNISACRPCCVCPKNDNVQLCNQSLTLTRNYGSDPDELLRTCYYCGRSQSKMNNYCYFCGMYQNVDEAEKMFYQTSKDMPTGTSGVINPTSRSMEIRYTSFAFMEFSSNNVEVQTPDTVTPLFSTSNLSQGSQDMERSDSILTIFKGGRRKSVTPNLGTSSFYSLSTSEHSEDVGTSLEETKSRKPLFRRLMSCLVLKSGRVSPLKLRSPYPNLLQPSSVDSYHISTSLGAIEIGSSLYDTSASFYSNHTIQPISNKMRRGGFLSSIRGFLGNKKSSRH